MDHMASRPQNDPRDAKPQRVRESQVGVCCDLCEAPYALPPEIASQGRIYGLLVCSQCVEDQLEALNYERTREAH